MQYDPIKKSLGKVFNQSLMMRKLFYHLLDVLLLRSWHIRKEIKRWYSNQKPELSVLDAGSGYGQYVYFLNTLDAKMKILGIDVKTEQIDDCQQFFDKLGKNKQVTFEVADLTGFIRENAYNLILSVDVMEHIAEDELVFFNFHKSLKKNGMLLISTPSDQGGSDVHDEHESSFIDEHVRDGYSVQDISEKLKRAGFSKMDVQYQYGIPGKISWKLSMKFPIIMLNVSKIFFIILPFYYLLVFPFCLVFNWFDVKLQHKSGTGLVVKAWK